MGDHEETGRGGWFHSKRTPRLALIVLGLTAFLFIIARFIETRGPSEEWSGAGDGLFILHLFEIACLLFMILSFLHAYMRWGRLKAVFFFMFALVYGIVLEEITVTFSGYYEYNPNAWIQFHNTMMAVPFCWTAVIYVCQYIIEQNPILNGLTKIEKGLVAGVLAVSIDVGIDAVFVSYGLWHWFEGQWFGVPLANYTAWFMAVGGFTVAWADIDKLKAHQHTKELGMAAGVVISYAMLLVMVYATYLVSEVWFG